MELKEFEKIDNLTNEIMDKLRDYIRNNIDKIYNEIDENCIMSETETDDEIYSIIHNELRNNIKYINALEKNASFFEEEVLTRKNIINCGRRIFRILL